MRKYEVDFHPGACGPRSVEKIAAAPGTFTYRSAFEAPTKAKFSGDISELLPATVSLQLRRLCHFRKLEAGAPTPLLYENCAGRGEPNPDRGAAAHSLLPRQRWKGSCPQANQRQELEYGTSSPCVLHKRGVAGPSQPRTRGWQSRWVWASKERSKFLLEAEPLSGLLWGPDRQAPPLHGMLTYIAPELFSGMIHLAVLLGFERRQMACHVLRELSVPLQGRYACQGTRRFMALHHICRKSSQERKEGCQNG